MKPLSARVINAAQWVCVAAIAVLLAMHIMGNAPPWRMMMVMIAGGTYLALFCLGKWLEWRHARSRDD